MHFCGQVVRCLHRCGGRRALRSGVIWHVCRRVQLRLIQVCWQLYSGVLLRRRLVVPDHERVRKVIT